ncbi:hypothetical protein BJY01DRAFT_252106 [Aspergillus pseudoustus]|uniref:2EXR domain-containing protein n=1 Tax=Aspergillus pseudoustus TaxID=1810923 RepID=A0ABR4J8H9_9EURO
MKRFPQFTRLPGELRRQIWQETCPLPGFHAFDVCIPSTSKDSRVYKALQTPENARESTEASFHIKKYSDTVFLDHFMSTTTMENKSHSTSTSQKCESDPSAYHITSSVRQTCFEALETLRARSSPPRSATSTTSRPTTPESSIRSTYSNGIYLPARRKWITYDNSNDVLFLRFGSPVSPPDTLLDEQEDYVRTFNSGLSDVLLCPWSEEFTETLRNARRVALDLAELEITAHASVNEEAVEQDIAYLACCLQNDLEVLYIIVHQSGSGSETDRVDIGSLQTMGPAGKSLSSPGFEKRDPNVFYGQGVTYHEVFALESFGLGEETREFQALKMLGDAIREQQGEQGMFRGVRALVCQRDRPTSIL